LFLAHHADDAAAKKKRRKRKKKRQNLKPLVFNDYGCIDAGQPCRGDDANCCSGICQGAAPKQGDPDTSRCIGHNALTCQDEQDACLQGFTPCGFGGSGQCVQSTGKASFCGAAGMCAVCQKDEDCEAMKGPGAACVVCAAACANSSGGTACYAAAIPALS
jgi:hypothetical protein